MAMTIAPEDKPVAVPPIDTAPAPLPPSPAGIDTGNDSPKSPIGSTTSNINTANNIKRKPSRRANTAERRATHNAVERQRRETLNSRFLDLAALLPNLSQIRRPSKSSIVNSSIAHIHASRRHRMLASRELRLVKAESDALRRELNEWRDRAGLPRVEEPVRSEAFAIVVNGEMDAMMVSAEMGVHHGTGTHMSSSMDEDLEDGDDDWGMGNGSYPNPDDEMAPAPGPPQPPPPQGPAYPMQPQGFSVPPQGYMSAQGAYPHHMQGFLDQEGRGPVSKANGTQFAHNIPRGSPIVGYGEAGAGTLFTPPVSRDGPTPTVPVSVQQHQHRGGSSSGGSVSGGASPAHSVNSQGQRQGSVHSAGSPDGRGRSMSGSPVVSQSQSQRRGESPNYELGYGYAGHAHHQQQHTQQQQHMQQSHDGSLGGMLHGYGGHHQGMNSLGGHPMGMGMGYSGHGHAGQHGGGLVSVGAGAIGGVFGMML